MKAAPRSHRLSTWLLAAGLMLFMAFIVYRSLHVAAVQCALCMSFHGQTACRTVQGSTERDARSGALTNVCAYLASGVTDSMACERTPPASVDCAALN